jgi:hypothetical protein
MVFFLLSMIGIFILQPKRIEVYLFIVTSFLVSATTILFFSSYLTFTSPYGRMQTFFPWTSLLQGIGQCVLLLNPALARWAKLEKVEGTNEKPLFIGADLKVIFTSFPVCNPTPVREISVPMVFCLTIII